MSNLKDFTQKNREHTGASGIKVSNDGLGSGDRVDEKGRLRFNDTTDLLEYYNGSAWKSIDAPPVITSFAIDGGSNVTSGVIDNEGGGTVSIAVNGALFDTTGANVTCVGCGETLSTVSINRNNATLLTCVFTEADFDISNSPYTLKVTNGSGLSAEIADALTADQTAPTFTNSADTTFSIFDGARSSVTISANDLCGASNASAYAIQSGSLPSGLSFNTSTAVITGSTSAVVSDTTSTFTIRATGDDATADRQFRITLKAPQRSTYTSPSTFSVPTGLSQVNVLVVAGGGGAGSQHAGAGGAGGLIYRPAFPVSGNQGITVGGGGSGGPNGHQPPPGSDSTFGTLTAKGGGGGGHGWPSSQSGKSGGSGGGGSGPGQPGGSATQPGQPGDSGTYGFGHSGGRSNAPAGAGGGGAGGGGNTNNNGSGAPGGPGKTYNISGGSVTYAGGGGGAGHNNNSAGSGGPGGGGRGGAHPGQPGADGSGNTGGGGGGGGFDGGRGGSGGNGIVIVEY